MISDSQSISINVVDLMKKIYSLCAKKNRLSEDWFKVLITSVVFLFLLFVKVALVYEKTKKIHNLYRLIV